MENDEMSRRELEAERAEVARVLEIAMLREAVKVLIDEVVKHNESYQYTTKVAVINYYKGLIEKIANSESILRCDEIMKAKHGILVSKENLEKCLLDYVLYRTNMEVVVECSRRIYKGKFVVPISDGRIEQWREKRYLNPCGIAIEDSCTMNGKHICRIELLSCNWKPGYKIVEMMFV